MAVTATTVVVDKSLTEAKAEKEGLSFNANAFKVLADFYSSGSIWDNWSAGTLYLRDASSVLTQSDFDKLDGKALSITGNVTDADTIPAKNSLTFNGVSYTHDDNENPFSVTHFLNITVKDSVFANTVISKNYTTKTSIRNGVPYAFDFSNNGSANISNSTIDVLDGYKNVTMLNSSAAKVTSAPEGRLTLTLESGELSGTLGFGGSLTAKFDREQEAGYTIGGITGFKNVTLTGLDPRKFPENTTEITVGSIVGGKFDYADDPEDRKYYSNGSFSVSNGINVADVSLFANVTVKDSSVRDIVGGESAMTVKSVTRNGMETHSATWRTGGRVTVNNSSAGNIIYYDSVALTNSSSGNIFRDPLSKMEINSVGAIQYTASSGSVNVKADKNSKSKTIKVGKSDPGEENTAIGGYAKVNISGYRDNRAPENNVSVYVDGDIVGGNAEIFSSDAGNDTDTATGSVTLANDVTVNGKISFFSNVNIKDSVVDNEIVYGDRKTTSKNSTKKGSSSDSSYEERNLVTTVTYKNDGKLTAVNSELGQVRDYANVSLTNTDGGDISRNMLASDIIEEYQWRWKNDDGKWEDWESNSPEEHHTYSAAGSVTVRADKSGWNRASMDDHSVKYFEVGNIDGYMNVTVNGFNDRSKNNQDIYVRAGNITGGSYEGVRDGDYHSGSALGRANFNSASAGNVFGYKSVNAVDTNINGNVIAGSDAGFYGFDPESNGGEPSAYYGSYTSSYKETGNGSNASGVAKSADRFSLTNGWVTGDVRGYNVVTLTGRDVEGTVDLGVEGTVDLGVAYSNGNSYSYVNGSSSEYHKTTATASATVRNAKVGGDITGYRMVTVDNSSVGGDIEFIDVERGDDAIQISTSYFDDWSGSSKGEITGKEIATGSLTVRDSGVKGDIRGYNSVNFTNGSAGKQGNIDNWIYNYNAKYSVKDGETVENNATLEYKASGNFTARVDKKGKSDLYQFGSVSGFEKVAISGFADKTAQKSVIVDGSITGGKLSVKGEAEIPDYGFSIDDIPEIIDVSDLVFAASGSVVLDKNVQVNDSVYGFDSVTVKDSAVAGEIKATPHEGDFNAVYDGVDYSEFAVSGKLVNLTNGKAGSVTGYKQVNIAGVYNEIGKYTGTAGDDTLKIAGNSALRVDSLDFGDGEKDKLLLEGTLIIDDPINLNWDSIESVSGRGAIAATTEKLADAESVCGTNINFIDLGGVAVGFKGAAWELADDSAVKAAFWDGESKLTGWLCGDFDSSYKTIVDTEDYIRFTATDNGNLIFGESADIAVSGWKVGAEDHLFTSNTFTVAAGSEYIIKLEKEGANSASYTVTFNPA